MPLNQVFPSFVLCTRKVGVPRRVIGGPTESNKWVAGTPDNEDGGQWRFWTQGRHRGHFSSFSINFI